MTDPERFHVVLTRHGRPLMHGWWADPATARHKFRSWIGEYGSLPGAHLALVDADEGELLDSWPEPEAD